MRFFQLLLLCLFLAFRCYAQNGVDFDEAVTLMLRNNRSIEGARYKVDAAEYELRAVRGLRAPTLNLKGVYLLMQRDIDIELGGAKGVVTQSLESLIGEGVNSGVITSGVATLISQGLSPLLSADWRYTVQRRSVGLLGLQLTMPIYAGGRINAAIQAAKKDVSIESCNRDATINAAYRTLVERYYGVVLLRSVVDVRREVVAAMKSHLADAIAMEEVGVVAHGDVLYVKYRLADAEQKLSASIDDLKVAERALCVAVGCDCVVSSEAKMFVANNIYQLDYYVDLSYDLNPVLARAKAEHELTGIGVKVARAELLPEVVAMGAASLYSYQLSDMAPRWAVGVGLNFTIFDGLRKERRFKAARMVERGVNSMVENGRDEVELLVEKEYYNVMSSLHRIESCSSSITLAATLLANAQSGFDAGVVAPSELVDAQVNLAAVRVDYLTATYDYCCALARLLEATGSIGQFAEYREIGELIDINNLK